MSKNDDATPTDAPPVTPSPKGSREKTPTPPTAEDRKKGARYRVLGEGEGDFCIYEVAPVGSDMPRGSLLPIPNVPRFLNTAAAMRWIRNESRDLLQGKQIMIFAARELLTVRVQTRPQVVIETKPKVVVTDPNKEQA